MNTRKPVVVGIDGSPGSMAALRWAVGTAARHRAPLHLVCAVGIPTDPNHELDDLYDEHALRDDAATYLATARDLACDPTADLDVTCTVADPRPETVLIGRSKDAHMIVVGSCGLGAIGRGVPGSVGSALARHAHCPVAVVPAQDSETVDTAVRPVVVGVDGSTCSAEAVDIAFDEAFRRRTGVVAVSTWSELAPHGPRATMHTRTRALQADSLAAAADRYPEVPVTPVVVEDRPARRILAEADCAQLVVVGSHGRGGFDGMTLGSVGQAVLHGTQVPLIITRPRD